MDPKNGSQCGPIRALERRPTGKTRIESVQPLGRKDTLSFRRCRDEYSNRHRKGCVVESRLHHSVDQSEGSNGVLRVRLVSLASSVLHVERDIQRCQPTMWQSRLMIRSSRAPFMRFQPHPCVPIGRKSCNGGVRPIRTLESRLVRRTRNGVLRTAHVGRRRVGSPLPRHIGEVGGEKKTTEIRREPPEFRSVESSVESSYRVAAEISSARRRPVEPSFLATPTTFRHDDVDDDDEMMIASRRVSEAPETLVWPSIFL